MARINNGFLEGMTGSLGNLVFYKRNGKTVVRQKPGPRKYTPTEQQIFQQKAFSIGQKFIAPLRRVLDHFYKDSSSKKEDGVNSSLSWVLKNAIENVDGEPKIIPEKIFLFRGYLSQLEGIQIRKMSTDLFEISWDAGSDTDFWKQHEKLVLVIYVPNRKLVHFIPEGKYRKEGSQLVTLPWKVSSEAEVYIFGGFCTVQKSKQEFSDIRFLGSI
ncbi:DUF6266 family protein [Algoriphagus taiwanensis]|uniref:Uncharacterized protein n=1 Tax=Algoriphagus taiwanensis TaxID=1445656 RepID=A0ABQ6Q6I4_9BACT|nr:hypothetical protein Ataiwa_37900 [Algoriphagus taiwanensis]